MELDRPVGGQPSRRALFLDRDGTINQDSPHYIKSLQEFRLLPGALEAMCRLASLDAEIFIVTNQAIIGRGIARPETVDQIHRHLVREVEAHGGRVTGVYLCPHAPADHCSCRKPRPGMLLRAAAEHGIDLSESYLIGDRDSDVAAARAAGCRPILITSTPRPGPEAQCPEVRDLAQAALHLEGVFHALANE